MKQSYLSRILQLTWGLFLGALGSVMVINAKIGYTPWDVFHVGLSQTIGISIGNVAIMISIAIGLIDILLGEKLGVGSILNIVLVGIFLDFVISLNIIPVSGNFIYSTIMLITGLMIIALGTYFYIETGLGAGPRDSLMVAFTRRTHLPIGVCRGTIELAAVILGWKLGGMVGVGTIIAAFTIGFWVQMVFKLFKFDATKIKHEQFNYTFKNILRNN